MPAAQRLLPSVRSDFHAHASHANCPHLAGSSFAPGSQCSRDALLSIQASARRAGLETAVLMSHATDPARPRHATRQEQGNLLHVLTEVLLANAQRRAKDAWLLAGVEAHVLPDGTLDVDNGILSHMDVVTVSRFSSPHQSPKRVLDVFLRLCTMPLVDIIGWPGRVIDHWNMQQWGHLCRQASDYKTALAVSQRSPLPAQALIAAAEQKTLIALGSDSHGELATVLSPSDRASKALVKEVLSAGVKPYRVLNFWPRLWVTRWLERREVPTRL